MASARINDAAGGSNVKVVARFRPPNALELREAGDVVVWIDEQGETVKLRSQETMKGPEANGFTFDRAFGMDSRQVEVFEYGVRGIVDDVLNGYNGTVFAYGQTGSGKTFTMMGADIDDAELKGLIPRITEQVFASIMASPPTTEYLVKVSYMEIYMERIRDLLAPQNDNLQIHEDKTNGVHVKGISDFYVGSAPEVYDIMRQGGLTRAVSSTNMNAESSRSHSIFVITIQQRNVETGTVKTGNLYLVDLAGSEKIGKTGATGQTLEEAKKINKSLSSLGNVINALTDGKSTHIPYRDSKLTRILQESLGGNSRTTLIVNCSPVLYNEAETLSTLRFGMRAKTIKNKARVNAELSPSELKALLKKAQRDLANREHYIQLVEVELAIWRAGGKVEQPSWASSEKVAGASLSAVAADSTLSKRESAGPQSRPFTPLNPAIDALREDGSRPQTPSTLAMDKDERDEFLRRENELADQLAERESAFKSQENLIQQIRNELGVLKAQEQTLSNENKLMSTDLSDHRLQLERLTYESKENAIVFDSIKEQNAELIAEIEDLRKSLADAKAISRNQSAEDKERKKVQKMAALLGSLEANTISEKEQQIRTVLAKLDAAAEADRPLSADEMTVVRSQLVDAHSVSRDQQERLLRAQEEAKLASRRRDDLEARLQQIERDYEEMIAKSLQEGDDGAIAGETLSHLKDKLQTQKSIKQDLAVSEIAELREQLDYKNSENRSLAVTVESLRGVNEDLKRAFAITAAGVEGGKSLAEGAKDMERIRRTMASQLADFDVMKKALMKDLQDRCEKVVELEISLDETREQCNTVLRNSNTKAQQRKMEFLTRNLEQLTLVQRQMVEQNSALKKDVAIAERKLMSRQDRIHSLEILLTEANEQVNARSQAYEVQLQQISARLSQAEAARGGTNNAMPYNFGRIAKPLRGGGTGEALGRPPFPSLPFQPTSKTADKRSSWFFTTGS